MKIEIEHVSKKIKDVPVISINMVGLEKNPGFKFTPSLIQHGLYALEFGDIFMRCLYRVRPYEAVPGSANALHEKWKKRVIEFLGTSNILSHRKYKKMCPLMCPATSEAAATRS